MHMLLMKDKYRLEHLKQHLTSSEMKAITSMLPMIEEEWCSFHNLSQSSLHQIAGICMFSKFIGHSSSIPFFSYNYLIFKDALILTQWISMQINCGILSRFCTDDEILDVVHRFRPNCLGNSAGSPLCCSPYEFEHSCLLEFQPLADIDVYSPDDEHSALSTETRRCISKPFVTIDQFQSYTIAERLANVVKEVSIHIWIYFIFSP